MSANHPYRAAWKPPRPPPRRLPPALWLKLHTGSAIGLMGWAVLLMGSLFAWVFGSQADSSGILFGWNRAERVPGVVEASWETGFSENNRSIWAVRYSFVDVAGRSHEGVSYTRAGRREPGTAVRVEHVQGDPSTSRVEGMRRRPLGGWVLFVVLIFPIVGAGMAAGAWRAARRPTRLLVEGKLGHGRLVSKHQTSTEVNDRTEYAMTFEFAAEGAGRYRVEARTHRPELLEDDAEEPLLYDPRDPSYATLLDHLPGTPRIRPDGEIAFRHSAAGILALALPPLTILVNLIAMSMVL
jgi:hypothetical protein